MTCGGNDDDDERMKRSGWRAMISRLWLARAEDRLMHGRHGRVPGGAASSIAAKNFRALNPGVQKIEPPRESGARKPAMRPWMWNRGIDVERAIVGLEVQAQSRCCAPSVQMLPVGKRHDLRP